MAVALAEVYRNLAHLHDAGVAWPEAVDVAAGRHAGALAPVREALSRGRPVAEAFEAVAPAIDLAALRAGEASGRLGPALKNLADRGDAEARRVREIRASLAYPWLVAHAAALLLGVPDWFAVPSRPLAALGWAALVLVPLHGTRLLARAAQRAAERDPASAERGWRHWFRSRAAVEEADARALTALGWLHDAGVAPLEALPLAARAGAGGRVAADLEDAVLSVKGGLPIATSLRRTPPDVAATLASGEAAGALTQACLHAARGLDEDASMRRKRFAARLPAFMTLALGAIVGWRVISFYTGYFSRFR